MFEICVLKMFNKYNYTHNYDIIVYIMHSLSFDYAQLKFL